MYLARLQKSEDKSKLRNLFAAEVLHKKFEPEAPVLSLNENKLSFGRNIVIESENEVKLDKDVELLSSQLQTLQKLGIAVKCGLLPLLIGQHLCGKTTIVRLLAQLHQTEVKVIPLSSETDAQDLLGSFEQVSIQPTS